MKKKIVFAVIAGTFAVASLAGCAGNTGTDTKSEATTAAVEAEAEAAAAEAEATTQSAEAGSTAALAEGADSDWYMQVLTDPAMTSKYSYCRFIDVNKDGVPVLILSTTDKSFVGAEDKACLMVYSNGEPKIVKEVGGAGGEIFYYDDDHNTLTYFSRLSGESHLEICEVKDGELKVVKTLDYFAPHHGEPDSDKPVYRIDGKDVTEKEYQDLFEDHAEEEDAVTYRSIN